MRNEKKKRCCFNIYIIIISRKHDVKIENYRKISQAPLGLCNEQFFLVFFFFFSKLGFVPSASLTKSYPRGNFGRFI